jgi:hypothetical protein
MSVLVRVQIFTHSETTETNANVLCVCAFFTHSETTETNAWRDVMQDLLLISTCTSHNSPQVMGVFVYAWACLCVSTFFTHSETTETNANVFLCMHSSHAFRTVSIELTRATLSGCSKPLKAVVQDDGFHVCIKAPLASRCLSLQFVRCNLIAGLLLLVRWGSRATPTSNPRGGV